ncbi:maleylpyruvate isomerase N-terminal domain-containing protein [Actinoplanes subtropicus]|uniref:maleylpyruvate isomerase N-terminal domain-containing protein n=1 Tax=Actinoplanes subtropicus TaxID=543632 RepID=UPI0009FCC438|nr:maleylpyruvate isomerase N-terminal domain-containing protein [Actinoplanes subtropicus]
MMTVPPDRDALVEALGRESRRVAEMVRRAERLDAPVPGLAWSAGQLAGHLCVVYRAFAGTVRGEAFGPELAGVIGTGDTLPEVVAATNARAVEVVHFERPAEAADALAEGASGLAGALAASPDLEVARPAPWYGAGVTRYVATLGAIGVSETLVHGRDLALALGGDPRMPAAAAVCAAPTVMSEMLPLLVDQRAARGLTATFELRVRGGRGFVLHLSEGVARSTPLPSADRPVDCVISLSACAALLVAFNRMPVWRAIATGQILSYGRRPWLGPRFRGLFLNP